MKLIAGLGNPGSKYENTRHNAGFIAMDFLCEHLKFSLQPGKGMWYEGSAEIGNEEVIFLKPVDFMNNSGVVIRNFLENSVTEIKTEDILIITDDFQLPLGTLRFRSRGSDGGHNGLHDIIYNLNTDNFPRMRIGIGKDTAIAKEEYVGYVLGQFSKEESKSLKKLKPVIVESIMCFINSGIHAAMNRYNKNYLVNNTDSDIQKDNT